VLGAAVVEVEDPAALASELREALERPGPTLIEMPA
jgi:thiamine pyrophosphate-dependent acetolactate synthase large subunit-like protein